MWLECKTSMHLGQQVELECVVFGDITPHGPQASLPEVQVQSMFICSADSMPVATRYRCAFWKAGDNRMSGLRFGITRMRFQEDVTGIRGGSKE